MRIVINASTVAIGGGLAVTYNFLEALNTLDHSHEILVISPINTGYKRFAGMKMKILEVPLILLKRIFRPFLDHVWLPMHIKKFRPNWIFSLGNLPVPMRVNQAILSDNPFTTLKDLSWYKLSVAEKVIHRFRNIIFRNRLKFVSLVFTQTEIQGKRFTDIFPGNYSIEILPNGPVFIQQKDEFKFNLPPKKQNELRLLLFSRYYPHKNIEILLELATLFKKDKVKISFITTIENHHGKKARRFLKQITKRNLSDFIINIGEVKHSSIKALYENMDGLLLPTLLESFSSTYLDAMKFGKPILTSNLDFAKEICKDAAWYFDPKCPGNIFKTIKSCYSTSDVRFEKINKARDLIKNHPEWPELAKKCLAIMGK